MNKWIKYLICLFLIYSFVWPVGVWAMKLFENSFWRIFLGGMIFYNLWMASEKLSHVFKIDLRKPFFKKERNENEK